jgi:hypothetical protein
MKHSMEGPQKPKNRAAIWSHIITPGVIPEGSQYIIETHIDVYCSTVHNSQAMETTQLSTTDE